MKLREVMRSAPWTINDTDTLGAAQRVMTRNAIRHLPVLSGGRLTGLLTERDILAERARDGELPWWAVPVRETQAREMRSARSRSDASMLSVFSGFGNRYDGP